MNEKEQLSEILQEIFEYADNHTGLSYYDLEAYAYENDKDHWIAALKHKQARRMIALYLRSRREQSGKPYTHPMRVSIQKAADAAAAYMRRHRPIYEMEEIADETVER